MLKLKSNSKPKKNFKTINPILFCKEVKKNPSKYKPSIKQACMNLINNQPKKIKKKSKKKKM